MEIIDDKETMKVVNANERNNKIINSTLASILSYTLVIFVFNLITAYFAKRYNLFKKLYYFKVEFAKNLDNWQLFPVRMTFSMGPLFLLLLGTICFILQRQVRKKPGIMKFFWLWMGIHFFNYFVANAILMPMTLRPQETPHLAVFATYMRWDDFTKLTLSIVSSLLLILIGAVASKPFVQTSNSTTQVAKIENRAFYLFQVVFIPFILSSIVNYFLFIDNVKILNLTSLICLFVVVLSIFISGLRNRMIMVYRFPETAEINKRLLITLVILVLLFKISPLNRGLQF
jgi:hypothetical protein